MFYQFTWSTDFEQFNFYTAERFLYNLKDNKEIPSQIPIGTELE